MRKVTSYKCPECGMKFSTLAGWSSHLDRHHPDTKPKDMTDLQFFYFTLTGKTHGTYSVMVTLAGMKPVASTIDTVIIPSVNKNMLNLQKVV